MLKKISDWILSNSHYEVKYNANDFTDSLVVDIDDDTKIARFTVWDDAFCMLEIIDVETGNYIINERRELSDEETVIEGFKEFVSLLRT
ncbi:immunity protein TriTu family protein [Serratia marcescens]|uniref:immunity protein TriTu family protein n=1 Tax=Serratia marcescens TaxID=615 RepID=UPI0013DD510A|nr:hypothetical protein [Serratia marcescens]MBH3213821.1 hypothetical protein [Serratia marcescens]